MNMSKVLNIPNILTLSRLVLSPILLPFLIVYVLTYNIVGVNFFLAFLFVLFSLTDFFDGYFARRYKLETQIGTLLDPIADKFLVYSVLVALLAAGKIYFYWVVILIGREFFMMGLRLIAQEQSITVSVSWLGKIKTALQMIVLTLIIANPYQHLSFRGTGLWWNGVELLLLLATIGMSVYSAYRYYRAFMAQYAEKNLPLISNDTIPQDDTDEPDESFYDAD